MSPAPADFEFSSPILAGGLADERLQAGTSTAPAGFLLSPARRNPERPRGPSLLSASLPRTRSAWTALDTTHAATAGLSFATRTPAGPLGSSQSAAAPSSLLAAASAGAGLARASIDRALEASAPATVGPSDHAPGGPPAAAPPDLERLTEEVFDRLRWRLAVERERFRE